jgi:hypothetical protein
MLPTKQPLKLKILSLAVIVILGLLGFRLYQRNIVNQRGDEGDAPGYYGLAVHFNCDEGPYFGKLRGDRDSSKSTVDGSDFCNRDDILGQNDEDAFANNFTILSANNSTTVFLPDIQANQQSYVLEVPVSEASTGDPVFAWIDFNGNGVFEPSEKAQAVCTKGVPVVVLNWVLPPALQSALTYARLRTCKKAFAAQAEYPDGAVKTGEVEDYTVRIIKKYIPNNEILKIIDFSSLNGKEEMKAVSKALSSVAMGGQQVHFRFSGVPAEIAGINNLHEASVYGLRIGHNSVPMSTSAPAVVTARFDTAQQNLRFSVLDIDGGDRVKIQGFYRGQSIPFQMSAITDNYFYNYNVATGEVYSSQFTDAGNDDFIPSSLDMGVEVLFNGFTDSIAIRYSDDGDSTAGTITLCNIGSRKNNLPAVTAGHFTATDNITNIALHWNITAHPQLAAYWIERSLDGLIYESVGRQSSPPGSNPNFVYYDETLPPGISGCYYRIKLIETDNHYSYSNTVYLKRNISYSHTGFTYVSHDFTTTLQLVLLKDLPGKSELRLYDYNGKILQQMALENLREKDTVTLKNLGSLGEGSYYTEIIHQQNKYLLEAFK